jgi:hypothetical protein
MKDLKHFIKTIILGYLNESKFSNLLSQMVKDDQSERRRYSNFVLSKFDGDYEKGAKEFAKINNRDTNDIFNDSVRLKKFTQIEFDFKLFTEKDWENYWLLAQHSDLYPEFQKKALNLIEKHLGTNSELYCYLYDRISCRESGKQKYGTQDICEKQ